jgi:hypothetical protein
MPARGENAGAPCGVRQRLRAEQGDAPFLIMLGSRVQAPCLSSLNHLNDAVSSGYLRLALHLALRLLNMGWQPLPEPPEKDVASYDFGGRARFLVDESLGVEVANVLRR